MEKKKRKLSGTLKTRLILSFGGVLLVPTLGIGAIAYTTAQSDTQQNLMTSATQSIALANDLIQTSFTRDEESLNTLTQLASTLEANKKQLKSVIDTFANQHKSEVLHAYVGFSDGQMMLNGNSALPKGYDPRVRSWYKDAMNNQGNPTISAPYKDASTGDMVVTVAETLPNNSGVVGIDIDTKTINKQLANIKIGANGYVTIFDKAHQVVSSPLVKSGTVLNTPWMNTMFSNQKGTVSFAFEGSKKDSAYVANPITGWRIAGIMYHSEILQKSNQILYRILIALLGGLIIGVLVGLWTVRNITKRLALVREASDRVSEGDLTQLLTITKNDEISTLGLSVNMMIESLREIVSKVNASSNLLSASAEQLTASSSETSKSSEGLSETVQNVLTATKDHTENTDNAIQSVNEMFKRIENITESAQAIFDSANGTTTQLEQGKRAVDDVVEKMTMIRDSSSALVHTVDELGEHSGNIGKIVETISEIARQTNLLSLNAAIEAARAGESGRGFSVVAQEIRNLAEKSSEEAKRITDFVNNIQSGIQQAVSSTNGSKQVVEEGMHAVQIAGKSFDRITDSIKDISEKVGTTKESMESVRDHAESVGSNVNHVSTVAQNISDSMENVSATSEEQVAIMEEITASASELAKTAEELQESVRKFSL